MPFSIEYYKKTKNWIWLILLFDLFYKSMINYLHLPQSINYFNDLACLILLHCVIMTGLRNDGIGAASFQFKIIVFLFVETVISYLINLYSPLTYIFGIRILFRFMIFFLACTLYADKKMIDRFFSLMYKVLIISVPLSTFQYLSGYTLDSITAFFSLGQKVRGGSAGLNAFLCIVCAYYLVSAISKKCPIYKCVISMIASVYLASIGELKMFYFELIIILVCVTIFTKISPKKILGSAIGIGVVLLGMKFYDFYYGKNNSLDFESMADYAGVSGRSYGSQYSLNRLTAIPYVWNKILDTASKRLFGLGAGYSDNISSSIFSSGFLEKHNDLGFHLWSVSLELVNIGLVGLFLYISFFVSVFVYAFIMQRRDIENVHYYVTCKIIVVIAFITLFYNTSLIIDIAAPFLYFVMAIPFVLKKSKGLSV